MSDFELGPAGPAPAPATPRDLGRPSPAEMRVLEQLCSGLSNGEIAAVLGCSEHTVKFHVLGITTKLAPRTGSRTEAACNAIRKGLVP